MHRTIVDGRMQCGLLPADRAVQLQPMIRMSADGGGYDVAPESGIRAMDVEPGSFDREVGRDGAPLKAILQDSAEIERLRLQPHVVTDAGDGPEMMRPSFYPNIAGRAMQRQVGLEIIHAAGQVSGDFVSDGYGDGLRQSARRQYTGQGR